MMCRQRVPLTLMVGLILGLIAGCQIFGRGPTDEEQIYALVERFVKAGNEGDLETIMSCFADDYEAETGDDKEAIRGLFEYIFSIGAEFQARQIVVYVAEDRKSAEVKNVHVLDTPYVLDLKKRRGTWLITGSRRSY